MSTSVLKKDCKSLSDIQPLQVCVTKSMLVVLVRNCNSSAYWW